MTKSATIRARIEPELKAEAEAVLAKIGLSPSDLIGMTYRQVVMQQGLPFPARIPNAETREAIAEDADTLEGYTDADAMMRDILRDTD